MSISLFRSIARQYQNLRAVNTVPMMNTISHLIENQVIKHRLPVNFYAGFQLFSRFPAQRGLYAKLGAVCRRVYIFGVPDIQPTPISGIEYIPIAPDSPLAREWFLLVDTPVFWTALMTQETEGQDDLTGGRRYDGLWTFDKEVVDRASLLMSQVMNTSYAPIVQRSYVQQTTHIAEISGRLISRLEGSRLHNRRRLVRLSTLHKLAEAQLVHDQLLNLLQEAAQILRTVFGASDAAIALNDDGERYIISASIGTVNVEGHALLSEQSPSGQAVASGQPVRITDARQTRDRDPLLPSAQTLIAVPIIGRRPYGVLTIGANQAEDWNDEDSQTLLAFASMLANVIDQYVDANGNVATPLAYARRLEQAIYTLRAPMSQMLTLERQLRREGNLNPMQIELLDQIENLTTTVAATVGDGQQPAGKILQPLNNYNEMRIGLGRGIGE